MRNLRSLSNKTNIPKTKLWRLLQEGEVKRHSSTLKPLFTQKNQEERYKFCRRFVNDSFQFCDMMDHVHIDEKRFYVDTDKKTYYLTKGEESPHRVTKFKRFIPKLMFMAGVARPRYDRHKKQTFDGKLGLWPFVFQEPERIKKHSTCSIIQKVFLETCQGSSSISN